MLTFFVAVLILFMKLQVEFSVSGKTSQSALIEAGMIGYGFTTPFVYYYTGGGEYDVLFFF